MQALKEMIKAALLELVCKNKHVTAALRRFEWRQSICCNLGGNTELCLRPMFWTGTFCFIRKDFLYGMDRT